MGRAVISGMTLEYEDRGAGEPVVCVHGAFIADAFAPLFSEHGLVDRYRLITYHRRGYVGSSGAAEPVSVAGQADDCRKLLAYLGVRRAHLVGHSFGGIIALQLALETPQLVHTLALLEPGLMVGESAQLYRQALVRGRQRYQEAGARVAVDEFLQMRWPVYREKLDSVLPGAFEQAVADAAAFYETDLPGGLEWQFGEAEARRITQPTLLVLGEKSATLDPRFAETYRLLVEWLPNAEGFLLPDATHFLQMENPSAIAVAFTRFFTRHPLADTATSGCRGGSHRT